MRSFLSTLAIAVLAVATFLWVPFLWELTFGILLFSLHFHKKDWFSVRLAMAMGVTVALGVPIFLLCYHSHLWMIQTGLCYLLLFGITLIVPFFCFDEPPVQLFLCGASGYMAQHIVSQFTQMLWRDAQSFYLSPDYRQLVLWLLSRLVLYAVIYLLLYFLFARRTAHISLSDRENRSLLRLSVITLVVVILLSSIRDAYAGESFALMAVSRLFSVFCCVFLLYLRSDILEKGAMEQEHREMLRLHMLQQKQYEQSKENIELINVKCHDLRHQLERWERQGGKPAPDELMEMTRLISIYDSAVKTGNETLDTLMSERSLYCEKHGIRLSCMVDGSKLSFMPVGDLCALFGNALENAIEAVSSIENEEDRVISFLVRENRGMLVITVDNNFTVVPVMDDGLPRTTKGDSLWHGYGLKSICLVAEKYGGDATVSVDEMFHLTVLLPLPTS